MRTYCHSVTIDGRTSARLAVSAAGGQATAWSAGRAPGDERVRQDQKYQLHGCAPVVSHDRDPPASAGRTGRSHPCQRRAGRPCCHRWRSPPGYHQLRTAGPAPQRLSAVKRAVCHPVCPRRSRLSDWTVTVRIPARHHGAHVLAQPRICGDDPQCVGDRVAQLSAAARPRCQAR